MSANGEALLKAEGVRKYFPIRKGVVFQREVARVHAVDDVTFDVRAGETVGLRQVDARPLHCSAA
jgi:ABC-type oligopeptide transport system ATPase subunit